MWCDNYILSETSSYVLYFLFWTFTPTFILEPKKVCIVNVKSEVQESIKKAPEMGLYSPLERMMGLKWFSFYLSITL